VGDESVSRVRGMVRTRDKVGVKEEIGKCKATSRVDEDVEMNYGRENEELRVCKLKAATYQPLTQSKDPFNHHHRYNPEIPRKSSINQPPNPHQW